MKSIFFNQRYIEIVVFFSFFIIGLILYKDFGFNIDEKFHRVNGFYWLNYIANFFSLNELVSITENKLQSISGFTLSDIEYYNKYSIIFDVPAAILEILLNLNSKIEFYYLRHILVFIYFFLGLIFIYKLFLNRFKTRSVAILGTILLFLTPRLFGDSFQNTKDIIFLTFLIISTYYSFKVIENSSIKNIFIFSFLSAVGISVRMFGIILPFSLIVMKIISTNENNFKRNIKNIFLVIILHSIFIIMIWPLLWENPINNLIGYFKILNDYFNAKVFFLGNYYNPSLLPYYYLPVWILISTPLLHLLLFFLGAVIIIRRFFLRFFSIKTNNPFPDLWRSISEKKDFYILINFISFFLILVFLNIKMYNSWRIAYFFNFYIIYFATFSIFLFYSRERYLQIKKKIFNFIFFVLIIFTIIRIIIYHPYQSLYFNIITPKFIKNNVEVDYTGLSSFEFLNEILDENKDKNKIRLGVASWYPIWRVLELIDKENKIEIVPIKKNDTADILYSNKISEVNKKFNKKYEIPKNFYKIKEHVIDGVVIYEVYKRKL